VILARIGGVFPAWTIGSQKDYIAHIVATSTPMKMRETNHEI